MDAMSNLKEAAKAIVRISPILAAVILLVGIAEAWLGPPFHEMVEAMLADRFDGSALMSGGVPNSVSHALWSWILLCASGPFLLLLPAFSVARTRSGDAHDIGTVVARSLRRWPLIVVPFALIELGTFLGWQLLIPGPFLELLCLYIVIALTLGRARDVLKGTFAPWIKRPMASVVVMLCYSATIMMTHLAMLAVLFLLGNSDDVMGSIFGDPSKTPLYASGALASIFSLFAAVCNAVLASVYLDCTEPLDTAVDPAPS